MESADITSPPNFLAIAIAKSDFPVPVHPLTIINGFVTEKSDFSIFEKILLTTLNFQSGELLKRIHQHSTISKTIKINNINIISDM